jgi:predicted kinase
MQNKEIRLTRGLPASGKSTMAHEWVAEDPDWRVRVNRDDLRKGAYNKYYDLSRHQEQTITLQEDVLVTAMLNAGISPIVDALHLKAAYVKRWFDLGNKLGVPVTVMDAPVTDVEMCVLRDSKREKQVGEAVIRDLAKRFLQKGKLPKLPENTPAVMTGRAYVPNRSLPKAVWLDIDGSIAEREHPLAPIPVRGPFDETRVFEDALIEHVHDVVLALNAAGYHIVVMSGRSMGCYDETKRWLDHHGVPYSDIFMRPIGDTRKDSIIKEEQFWAHVAPKYDIRFALDDRQQVVDHTRQVLKIPVFQVQPGDF